MNDEPVMSHLPPRPTDLAQQFIGGILSAGDIAIDATAGNGHDTLFLAEAVGAEGRVLAFDVQEAAIVSSRARIVEGGFADRVEFFHQSHSAMAEHAVAGTVAAVMFNLGYLPGADHSVATGGDTIAALEAATDLIRGGGVLSVVCYPGHDGGGEEARQVETWMATLPARGWRVAKYGALGTLKPAPYLLLAVLRAAGAS
ncbi:methyltransferase domain-containing protein [Luteolibacter sp. SL250]|uniref:class I SAM-dependent methyltransferase n=1 Tax=Luteolibacter sp. SL250 TaxID=2995170 RepID=UPI002271A6FC|nr:class I SAM-dependent methyltransferase [Luteolibacter sp. SL250]WAC18421.1 methyltransferase domain-containing protein [Luteolibacter sp. SL250]